MERSHLLLLLKSAPWRRGNEQEISLCVRITNNTCRHLFMLLNNELIYYTGGNQQHAFLYLSSIIWASHSLHWWRKNTPEKSTNMAVEAWSESIKCNFILNALFLKTFLRFGQAAWHEGSWFPNQVLNLHPLQWKCSLNYWTVRKDPLKAFSKQTLYIRMISDLQRRCEDRTEFLYVPTPSFPCCQHNLSQFMKQYWYKYTLLYCS